MGHLTELFIPIEKLKILFEVSDKKGLKGVSLTISTSDEVNQYGQNVSAFVSQSKEDREAKKAKFYCGNGKVFWSDGKAPFIPKQEQKQAHTPKQEYSNDELPF